MADYTAKEYIQMQKIEQDKQSNIRYLWQETADLMYPYVQITAMYENGTPRTTSIYDMTPYLDMCDMVSGLKLVLIPSGQTFFALKTSGSQIMSDDAQRYLSSATEIAHEKIYDSNFVTEFDEDLRSLVIFGPGLIFTEWVKGIGLNYKTMDIGDYQLIEDSTKNVIAEFIKFEMTAKNAVEEFGSEVGGSVLKAVEKPETENNKFWFIYSAKPRKNRNMNLSSKYNMNMPYEGVVVNITDEKIVREEGFEENPFQSGRWMRPGKEKDGRGIGTEMLPQIKVLNKLTKDFIEIGNKWADPPLEKVSNDVEGDVDTRPGAVNEVMKRNSIGAIEQNALGNFPITENTLDRQTKIIDRAFFVNAFSPLNEDTGDRMTTLEVRQRIKQAWHKIGPPIARIWYEQLTKCLTRSVLLLIRNGEIPYPPTELQGVNFGIEFVGPFALELRSQQAKAFQEWVGWVSEMEATFPGAKDNVDEDDAIMRMGRTFGVNTEDMATEEERNAKRQARAERQAKIEQMQMAQLMAQGYKDTTQAPEDGSPAGKVLEGVG